MVEWRLVYRGIADNERVLAMAGKKKSKISILTKPSQCFFGLTKLQKKDNTKSSGGEEFPNFQFRDSSPLLPILSYLQSLLLLY